MKNIAILIGGDSNEKRVSLESGETIYKNIDKEKYQAYKVLCVKNHHFEVITENKNIKINNQDFSFELNSRRIIFDKVFMMIHGSPAEDGKLCDYFDEKKIPYTSSNKTSSELTFNKFKCNNYLRSLGYVVPDAQLCDNKFNITYPCIVKPSCSGSSFGITKVNKQIDLNPAIKKAKQYDKEVIIENFIKGKEITCGVLTLEHQIHTLPITEIISQNEIFDYDAKYHGKSIEQTPAEINQQLTESIQNIAKKIYSDLHLSSIVRIDFIIEKEQPYIIEINTIPGFTEKSIIPQMLNAAKIEMKQFITEQLEII